MPSLKNPKKRRILVLPLSRLFPNMLTIAGLCCGLSSIRFAMDAKFEIAVTLICIAALIDGMDGRVARLLNATSNFGANLDSLSDLICFGVSPVIVTYMWKMHLIKKFGWAAVLFFVVCCALRLARFNTALNDEEKESWQEKFFTGIPSPAGAMIALLPLVSSFYLGDSIFTGSIFCIFWIIAVGLLMASRIPTFAVKRIIIRHEWVLSIMLACGLAIVILIIEPWIMFTFIGLGYLATIPVSFKHYRRLAAINKRNVDRV